MTKFKGDNSGTTSKLHRAQLQYLTNYCTNFQKNRHRTVGEVCDLKLLEYDTRLQKIAKFKER